MTSIEGLTGRFQPDPFAGADNQYTHDEPVISESMVSPDYSLGGDASVDHGGQWALPSQPSAVDGWLGCRSRASNRLMTSYGSLLDRDYPNPILFETTSQITDPSRWMATQAVIFLPTLIGSTRQYMMKGVPSFL